MKSSGNSSTGSPPPPAAPPRDAFALTGRSATLDPRTHAVRPDLADARLADRVFAPHYVMPVMRTLLTAATLRVARGADAEVLAELKAGEGFELLDVTGDAAWGVAPGHGLVGYLPAVALGA